MQRVRASAEFERATFRPATYITLVYYNITGSIFRQRRGRSVYRYGRIDGLRRWLKMGWIEPLADTGSMGVESWGEL
jgi:hypothetical protein